MVALLEVGATAAWPGKFKGACETDPLDGRGDDAHVAYIRLLSSFAFRSLAAAGPGSHDA